VSLPIVSAGSEQIVALSLIGALNRCATREGPVVMDTPFGRLDRRHGSEFSNSHRVSALRLSCLCSPANWSGNGTWWTWPPTFRGSTALNGTERPIDHVFRRSHHDRDSASPDAPDKAPNWANARGRGAA
jgi:hypothetical protein